MIASQAATAIQSPPPKAPHGRMSTDLDTYCENYLVEWEKRATVRTKLRTRLTQESLKQELFTHPLKPFLQHEAVIALGPKAVHDFSLQAACNLFQGVANFEIDFVANICAKIANHSIGVALPEAAKQVAISIGTDEMYHAFTARECLNDIKLHTGVEPFEPVSVAPTDFGEKVPPLDFFKSAVPKHLEAIAETTLLCLLENTFTEELYGLSKDATKDSPMHIIMREHILDEGRHMVYFQRLLKHIWSNITEDDRISLGQALVKYCDHYLVIDAAASFTGYTHVLHQLGLDKDTSIKIARETVDGEPEPTKDQMKSIVNPLHLMRVAGILDHAPTHQLLLNSGWILK
jgi:hypothetical protein